MAFLAANRPTPEAFPMPLILGITGSIAAGKSLLSSHLVRNYGAIHVDADREIHQLYAPGLPGFDRVVAAFGSDIVGADGIIDRKILGSKVFGNPERMAALREAIGDIPAHFIAVIRRWREELPADVIALFDAVNILEGEYMAIIDAAWLVACERDTAIERMMRDRGHSREEAEQRLASARDWRERAPLADHVFHNDGTVEAFLAEVDSVLAETRARHAAGTLPEPRWRVAQRS